MVTCVSFKRGNLIIFMVFPVSHFCLYLDIISEESHFYLRLSRSQGGLIRCWCSVQLFHIQQNIMVLLLVITDSSLRFFSPIFTFGQRKIKLGHRTLIHNIEIFYHYWDSAGQMVVQGTLFLLGQVNPAYSFFFGRLCCWIIWHDNGCPFLTLYRMHQSSGI